jgi:hypothetical protein
MDVVLDSYAALLAKYVTPQGVRYDAWRGTPADVKALSAGVAAMGAVDPRKLRPAEKYALYINLYNAKVLQIVLEERPTRSIKEVTPGVTGFGVFLKPVLELAGERISLRGLEDRLRAESKDPRIHFAINCASRSCPPIAPELYIAERLDAQLDRATRAFLASPGALTVRDGKSLLRQPTVTIVASKIFDWYAKDFKASGGALAFIEKHGPADVVGAIRKAGRSARLAYQDYDWSLNSAS